MSYISWMPPKSASLMSLIGFIGLINSEGWHLRLKSNHVFERFGWSL